MSVTNHESEPCPLLSVSIAGLHFVDVSRDDPEGMMDGQVAGGDLTMKRLWEFAIDGAPDQHVIVEVDQPIAEGEELAARSDKVLLADRDFQKALARVRPAADSLMRTLQGLAIVPEEATVEFGIKLSGTMGAVIASAGMEANFIVTLKWQPRGRVPHEPETGQGVS